MPPKSLPQPDADESVSLEEHDWEARFKGLQREYDKLHHSLHGKEGYATQLQQELNQLKAEREGIAVTAEGKITQLSAELDTLRRDLSQRESQAAAIERENAALKRDQEIRRFLVKDYADLLPWFESGYLHVDTLESEALTTHLNGFRQMLGHKAQVAVESTLKGASPPSVAPQTQTPELTAEYLYDFLTDPRNESKPEYATYRSLYLDLVSQS